MPRRALGILVSVIGVGLVGVGLSRYLLSPPQSYWSDQQAEEYTAAALELKAVATRPDRPPSGVDDPALAAAQARFDKVRADLERATQRRDYFGMLLGAIGMVLVVAGVGIYLSAPASRTDASQRR